MSIKKEKKRKRKRFLKRVLFVFQHGLSPFDILVYHNNTIGGFYKHILHGLGYLTDCGTNNSIFTGDVSKQVTHNNWTANGHSMKVTNYSSAVYAIKAIIDQGEGSSPCNPDATSQEKEEELSHYYTFLSIYHGREIEVHPNPHREEVTISSREF